MMVRVDTTAPSCHRACNAHCRKHRHSVTTSRTIDPRDAADLVATHGNYVWRTLRLLGVRAADVDDVTQEVLLAAVRQRHTHEGRGTLRAWIRGICVRQAAKHRRKAYVRREVSTTSVPSAATTPHPDDVLEHTRQLRRLYAALESLKEAPRAVFVLYEIEGLSMREVANAVGCPLQTAYSRHRTARTHIQAAMRRSRVAPSQQTAQSQSEVQYDR